MGKLPIGWVYTTWLSYTFLGNFTCWLVLVVSLRRQTWATTSGLSCVPGRLMVASFRFLQLFFRRVWSISDTTISFLLCPLASTCNFDAYLNKGAIQSTLHHCQLVAHYGLKFMECIVFICLNTKNMKFKLNYYIFPNITTILSNFWKWD